MTATTTTTSSGRTRRHPLRTARRLATVVVLAGAAATGGFVLIRTHDTTPAGPAKVLKTAEVTSGNLTTTEKIDGSLELSDTMTVLHRIEGQTSSADTISSSSAVGSGGASTPGGSLGASATGLAAAAIGASITHLLAVVPVCTDDTGATTTTTAPSTPGAPVCPSGPDPSVPPTTAIPTTAIPTTAAATTPGTPVPADAPTTLPTNGSVPDRAAATTTSEVTTETSVAAGGFGGVGGTRPGGPTSGGTGSSGSAPSSSSTRVTQTVTSVIHAGATVGLGDVLYTVDSQPVVALSGTLPAWRTLSTSSTDGPDVGQLESSLVSLGYDPNGTVTVDDTFNSATKAMVKRWQAGLGIEATGMVTLGSVVFLPTTTTVSAVSAAVGDAVGDGDAIVSLTAATQDVVIDVPDGDESFIEPGLDVQLGSGGSGTVSLLRSVERSGAVVVQAVITPTAPIEGVSTGGTVKVTITTDDVDGVLIVPADALLSHLDGTYAVQIQAVDGTVTWHTVELLGVSGNKVGIRGTGVTAGSLVLVPA